MTFEPSIIVEHTKNPDHSQPDVGSAAVEPIVVVASRGGVVESTHRANAVAVRDGVVVASAGDPHVVAYFRSSAKPLQALPVVRARPDLDEVEVAIACASHLARPEQLDAVRSLLAKAPASEDELECGPEPTRLEHNCSGKHAGMLALCRALEWESAGYRLAAHPCQQAMRREVAAAAELDADSVPSAIDGCGVVTFGLTLERMATAFARLPGLEGAERVIQAMRAHPELIRGQGAPDTMLMQVLPGWIAKGGAEGLVCAVSDDGLGLALKIVDGAGRAVRSALAGFLSQLGFDTGDLGVVPIESSRGELVGELRLGVKID
jgi:L-asparaginase II